MVPRREKDQIPKRCHKQNGQRKCLESSFLTSESLASDEAIQGLGSQKLWRGCSGRELSVCSKSPPHPTHYGEGMKPSSRRKASMESLLRVLHSQGAQETGL